MSANSSREMMNRPADARTTESHWLYIVGGAAALIVLVLFLIGIAGVVTADPQSTAGDGWLTSLGNNWLVVLFKLNAGFSGVRAAALNVLNLLDIAIMVLCGVMLLALYAALGRTHRIGSLIAASLPFLGIVVFLVTGTAGRSGLLVGGLIISIVMLRGNQFSRVCAYAGTAASALLFFAGDIATAMFSSSPIIAICIGVGYALWMVWFLLVARRLLQLGRLEGKALSHQS